VRSSSKDERIKSQLQIEGTGIDERPFNSNVASGTSNAIDSSSGDGQYIQYNGIFRFDSSFDVIINIGNNVTPSVGAEVEYVLD